MTIPRREFLHVTAGAAAIATLAESAIPIGAKAQPPGKGVSPKRSARDRLEDALARIAEPKGEGARAALRSIPMPHVLPPTPLMPAHVLASR
jgi:hypothetical protein